MSLNWLRQNRWRLVRWSLFVLLLAGVGVGLYYWLPPVPRWVLRGSFIPNGLTPDGKQFVSLVVARTDRPSRNRSPSYAWWPPCGPVRVHDVATGTEVRSVFSEDGPRWTVDISRDGKRVAAVDASAKELRSIDLQSGASSRETLARVVERWRIEFSPAGDLLLLQEEGQGEGPARLSLFEVGSLRLIADLKLPLLWPLSQWSHDGHALLVYTTTPRGDGVVRSIGATGEKQTRVTGAGPWLGIADDATTIVTQSPEDGERRDDQLLFWDLTTGKRRGAIPADGFRLGFNTVAVFPDGRLVLRHRQWGPDRTISAWDLETGTQLGAVRWAPEAVDKHDKILLSERNAFAVWQRDVGPLTVYRARPFGKLWERTWEGQRLHTVAPVSNAGLILAYAGSSPARVELLDAETGAIRHTFLLNARDDHDWLICGQFLALQSHQPQDTQRGELRKWIENYLPFALPHGERPWTTTQIIDIDTGEELSRFDLPDARVQGMTADGRSLLIDQEDAGDGEPAFSCYDVPPRRAWVWIVGVPIALSVAVLALRAGWQRWRRGKAQPAQAPVPAKK